MAAVLTLIDMELAAHEIVRLHRTTFPTYDLQVMSLTSNKLEFTSG
jgi:hypothetical protein